MSDEENRRIVHDLNNALLPVRAYGELAVRKLSHGEDANEELRELLTAVERLARATRAMLGD